MHFTFIQCSKNATAAAASPQIPLGSKQHSPYPLTGFKGAASWRKKRKCKGNSKEKGWGGKLNLM